MTRTLRILLLALWAAPALSLEFRRLAGTADAEDTQQWLYFAGETVQFALAADAPPAGQSERPATHYRSLALFLIDGRDPEDLEPSPIDYQPGAGLTIDPEQVWLDTRERLIGLRVGGTGSAARWHLLDAVNGKQVLDTVAGPEPAQRHPDEPLLRWPAPLPKSLARYDGRRFDDWRGVLELPDRSRLQHWRTLTRTAFAELKFADSQADLRRQVDDWLTAQPPETLGDGSQLLGDWSVRSIQAHTDLGVYDYPWFRATIRRDPRGGLRFAKTTGSQRRSGLLLRDREHPGRLVFAGASTVNEEPARDYSALLAAADEAAMAADSVGEFLLLEPDRAILVLDVSELGFEIYELRR